MVKFDKFRYLYPPKCENKIKPEKLPHYDRGEYLAQIKYNGDCCVLFLREGEQHFYNRHRDLVALNKYKDIDLFGAYRGSGWMAVCGELMAKSKLDEHGNKLTGFIIWDILVYDNEYLTGETVLARMDLLEKLYPTQRMLVKEDGSLLQYKHLSFTDASDIYRAPVYAHGFKELFDEATKTDAYEGLLLKRAEAQLDFGYNGINNTFWQIKARKPTNIYSH